MLSCATTHQSTLFMHACRYEGLDYICGQFYQDFDDLMDRARILMRKSKGNEIAQTVHEALNAEGELVPETDSEGGQRLQLTDRFLRTLHRDTTVRELQDFANYIDNTAHSIKALSSFMEPFQMEGYAYITNKKPAEGERPPRMGAFLGMVVFLGRMLSPDGCFSRKDAFLGSDIVLGERNNSDSDHLSHRFYHDALHTGFEFKRQSLHVDVDASPSCNVQPEEGHWSYQQGRKPGSRPFHMIVNLSEEAPLRLHGISYSSEMMIDYDQEQALNMELLRERAPEGMLDGREGLAAFYASEVTDATIAERWRSKVKAVDTELPFGYGYVFDCLHIHAGGKGVPKDAAIRLFIHYNHRDGPRYDSNPETTYTVPFCKTGLMTQKISDMLEEKMLEKR